MIFRDDVGLVVDSTGDGGDSANRAGLLAICGKPENLWCYVDSEGLCKRHPIQRPWNNPWNFSRDQLLAFTAGLKSQDNTDLARKILINHAKRLFFCQNFQRDVPGSWKFPWPHTFVNDRGEVETCNFDFADPLFPDHIWHLILCAELRSFYFFAVIGIPWFVVSLWYFCHFDTSDDEGQILAQCQVQGKWAIRLYEKWRTGFWGKLKAYWFERRQMLEMAKLLFGLIANANDLGHTELSSSQSVVSPNPVTRHITLV